ncbi:MAG: response regulator transcription factor [Albidovulum sp.]|nr:response regulator transcription factor [Albidovulum sp.]MDE0533001.1 response regulator transcription factor [Albidovulum sp.]
MKAGRPTALLIEDIVPVLKDIAIYFEEEGFEVLAASDAQTALKLARNGNPDVIILDLGLPEPETGRKLCVSLAGLKEKPPIIVLTQHHENLENSLLREGAIDFVEKPFKVSELVARARAQIIRQQKLGQSPTKVGAITYHPQDGRLEFPDGANETVTPAEKTIFEEFLNSGDGVVTKPQLKRSLNYAENTETKTVETHMWRLRTKIRNRIDGYPTIITLRNGKGYRLIR